MKTIKDVPLEASDRDAIERAATIIRTAVPVEAIYLFGSKARGDDDPESDIDLLVLTGEPLSWSERDAVREKLHELRTSAEVCLSTLYIPYREWVEGMMQVHPLKAEVERDGALV